MTTVVAPAATTPPVSPGGARGRRPRSLRWHWSLRSQWSDAAPTAFVLVNAIAFVLVRPGVNDLWAARARASAVDHGVGLTYWFGWFGGGSTPGNYSVVTPYLCAWLGTEFVGALAAVAAAALATLAVRGTRSPRLAAALAALAVAANLWSGRVAFLLGCAFALGALLAVRARRRLPAVVLSLLAILGSPVAGAFLLLGLAGSFLVARSGVQHRDAYRPVIAAVAVTVVAALGLDALVFGAGGPEPLSWTRFGILLVGMALLLAADLPRDLRVTVGLSVATLLVIAVVPNSMGSNFARFAWFFLPVAVVALGRAPAARRLLLVAPLTVAGLAATVGDLAAARGPGSSVAYYQPLVQRLGHVPDLADHRVEVVDHGSHAGYDALLGHATLARGWETQSDLALNAVLEHAPLGSVAYRRWLDDNAVGWVALPRTADAAGPDAAKQYPEYALVAHRRPSYLAPVWHDARWQLFRVRAARPIVAAPAGLVGHTQSSMTVRVPCACTVRIRVRWSKFLSAVRVRRVTTPTTGTPVRASRTQLVAVTPIVAAQVTPDRSGWTRVITAEAGSYELQGSLGGLLH